MAKIEKKGAPKPGGRPVKLGTPKASPSKPGGRPTSSPKGK